MVLIVTLIRVPGVGCPQPLATRTGAQGQHNALAELQTQMQRVAREHGYDWSERYPALGTLRKDLERLRDYGILEPRMYRWGYYLGTGVMTVRELQAALNSLESQGKYQGDPQIRRMYEQILQRLRGFPFPAQGSKNQPYPVRQNINRAINYTDPDEMYKKQQYRDTLFHCVPLLEEVILEGLPVEISRSVDWYGEKALGTDLVWPLQLMYRDTAWYLLYERCANNQLVVGRMNRYGDYCRVLIPKGRGIDAQWLSLEQAYCLLERGWGLKLGSLEEQQAELQGKGEEVEVAVRFFPPISEFIQEGELRHPRQTLQRGRGKGQDYLDYGVVLPRRSLDEFSIWVQRYADKVQVLTPPELVEKHRQMALRLLEHYPLAQRVSNSP